jgi:hypothetical protein
MYGFSEFLDFPESNLVPRAFPFWGKALGTRLSRKSSETILYNLCRQILDTVVKLMEFKHPETYFNKIKLRIKLVKIHR